MLNEEKKEKKQTSRWNLLVDFKSGCFPSLKIVISLKHGGGSMMLGEGGVALGIMKEKYVAIYNL